MKVISILGSPRKKGTSARIAGSFTEVAAANGAEVTEYYLNGMKYKGCQGCEKCHSKQDKCILQDDLTPLLDDMRTADVMVFATPVYYLDATGQFKTFFDRTWSQLHVDYSAENPFTPRIPKGKKAVLIITQATPAEQQQGVVERYSMIMDLYGLDYQVIRGTDLPMTGPDVDVSTQQAEAVAIAESILKV